jgi:hypothetical protein
VENYLGLEPPDLEQAAIQVGVARAVASMPGASVLDLLLPWRAQLKRLGELERRAPAPPTDRDDVIEHFADVYLTEARKKLNPGLSMLELGRLLAGLDA